ncbi:ribonuclease H-like domain-containing protein [Tanacetum coccineum]
MSVHNSEHNSPHNTDHDDIYDSVTRISKLDISDPLHLHPNDTTALAVVSIKLKGTENYQVWSCAMLLALKGKNKIGFIDGSCKRSNTYEVLGLDDSYMQIRSSILSREVLSDVRNAYATISSEESHRVDVGSIAGSSQRSQASAFVSNVPNSQNFQRSNQNSNTGPSRTYNMNNNRPSGGSGLNNNRPNGGSGQNVKKQGVSNNNSIGKSLSSGFSDEQWLFSYLLSKTIKLERMCRPIWQIKVGHPNGTEAFISKIGNLKLSNGLTLYDVMVIPEYCVTLISVHKMAKENKIFVVFDESKCYFVNQDLNLKNIMGTGDQCEGLYYYNEQGIRVNKSNLNFQCLLSQYDWHCRLGHPAEPVMNILKKSLNFDKSDKDLCCEVCQRAKQTREPFPLSDHVSSSLGELVHLDLWGPYRVTSSEGYKYFLTIVDDYTRAVWVYLIKSKDEVSHFITVFYNLIENQFNKKIKVFRSDNGTEFVNQYVNKFCADKGRNTFEDVFGSRSEKCVLLGYSSVKKGYRLYSLDKHRFIFSRDVKFFENIFPFKDSDKIKNATENVFQDVNHINFFDIEYLEIPNDDERVDPNLNSDINKSQSASSSSSESSGVSITVDFLVNSGKDTDSSDNNFTTQDEGVTTLEENIFTEGNMDKNSNTISQDEGLLDKVSMRHEVLRIHWGYSFGESCIKDLESLHLGIFVMI